MHSVDVMKVGGNKLVYLCLLLRLAVLLNHSRSDEMLPAIELSVDQCATMATQCFW